MQEGKEEQLCCWDAVQVFVRRFICAEFRDENNWLSVWARTLCAPWGSEQAPCVVLLPPGLGRGGLLVQMLVNPLWGAKSVPFGAQCLLSGVFGKGS